MKVSVASPICNFIKMIATINNILMLSKEMQALMLQILILFQWQEILQIFVVDTTLNQTGQQQV